MKFFFWTQAAFSLICSLLGLVVQLTGGPVNAEFSRHSLLLFAISAGFLWVHSAISKLKVKP